MNLYHISQTVNNDWDTYSDAVVAAESEERAKQIHPNGDICLETWMPTPLWNPCRNWAIPEYVQVELIGSAIEGTKEG